MADPCAGTYRQAEIKLLTAAVYSNYVTHIVDDTGIEQGDGYTGRPASEQLWLRLERVSCARAPADGDAVQPGNASVQEPVKGV